MSEDPILPAGVLSLLRCPVCKKSLLLQEQEYVCQNPNCKARFPVLDGIPILINEQSSVFSIEQFVEHKSTTFNLKENAATRIIKRFMPSIASNVKASTNYKKIAELLLERSETPKVLVLGGSILGAGMDCLLKYPSIMTVDTDVSFGQRTMMICDAHDIPFEDKAFDGVIVQAVLEHIVDPYRCVDEIYRVLKDDAIVYAETPFMQQVHGRQYDFTRFTHLGHRRLFRHFEEIDSGAVCGPGSALAQAYQYFLLSFPKSAAMRGAVSLFARFTSFWLKYLDYLIINNPGSLDAASGCFFLGRKTDRMLSDKELIGLYRGAF